MSRLESYKKTREEHDELRAREAVARAATDGDIIELAKNPQQQIGYLNKRLSAESAQQLLRLKRIPHRQLALDYGDPSANMGEANTSIEITTQDRQGKLTEIILVGASSAATTLRVSPNDISGNGLYVYVITDGKFLDASNDMFTLKWPGMRNLPPTSATSIERNFGNI